MRKNLAVLVLLSLCLIGCKQLDSQPEASKHEDSKVHWQSEWNDQVFEDAKKNNKLIILNLEAIWCHWCHVMQAETYANDDVAKLLNDNFIALKIDQDSNSYLSNRYKDYGWPATIMFNAQGQEIVKRAGYIDPESMKKLLAAVIADPSPENDYSEAIQYSTTSYLSEELKQQLRTNYSSSLDLKLGGLNLAQKYIDRDTIEYGLLIAKESGPQAESAKASTLQTLKAAIAISDSEWGGFYQYSTHGDWDHAHYEKLASVQAEYLRIYSLAQLQYPHPQFKQTIFATVKYIDQFLTDFSGAFYTSQDADLIQGKKASDYFKLSDKERKAKGIPKVDKNIYADRNGRIIEALVMAYRAIQDPKLLARAIKAAQTINRTHKHSNNSYKHGAKDKHSYLSDNLYMAAATLALYEATADRKWLTSSKQIAEYIIDNYKSSEPGYLSNDKQDRAANAKINSLLKPSPVLEENIKLARLFNLLAHYTGVNKFKDEAKYIMQYLASKEVALSSLSEPGILIVDRELAEDPVHFTIVGSKRDSKAKKLFTTALQYPATYIRIEWYDRKEGKLMNPDVEYPELPQAAAFSCINHACSLPIYDKAELLATP